MLSDTTATAERNITVLGPNGYEITGLGLKVSGGRLVILSAAEIAAPTPDILALIYDRFQSADYPYSRYRSTGIALIPEGAGSSSSASGDADALRRRLMIEGVI